MTELPELPKSGSPKPKPKDQSWESFADERIRRAYEEGEFAKLAGFGKPIPGIDDPLDELWWVRKKLREEELAVPAPGTEIRTDIERTLARVAKMATETEARGHLLLLNERIRQSNRRMIGHANGTVMELDVDGIMAALKSS